MGRVALFEGAAGLAVGVARRPVPLVPAAWARSTLVRGSWWMDIEGMSQQVPTMASGLVGTEAAAMACVGLTKDYGAGQGVLPGLDGAAG
jgi:hypothetical protein